MIDWEKRSRNLRGFQCFPDTFIPDTFIPDIVLHWNSRENEQRSRFLKQRTWHVIYILGMHRLFMLRQSICIQNATYINTALQYIYKVYNSTKWHSKNNKNKCWHKNKCWDLSSKLIDLCPMAIAFVFSRRLSRMHY